jgi:hypothetical protein
MKDVHFRALKTIKLNFSDKSAGLSGGFVHMFSNTSEHHSREVRIYGHPDPEKKVIYQSSLPFSTVLPFLLCDWQCNQMWTLCRRKREGCRGHAG